MAGSRKTVMTVLALIFSFLSVSVVFGAEKPKKEEPSYVRYVKTAENACAWDEEYIPVLMYHHFSLEDAGIGDGMVVTAAELEDHLKYFQSHGYEIISLETLDEILDKVTFLKRMEKDKSPKMELNHKYLCITMDDGYLSNYELGYPLFQKYQVPVSIFAVTDSITEHTGVEKFTWEQAQETENSGFVKVYSHSADHEPVQKGKEEIFLASAQKSETTLAEYLTKDRVKVIAYPNGRYTAESKRLLSEEGYVMQFTIQNGIITAHTKRDQIPRITVSSGMDGRDIIRKIELAAEMAFAGK